MSQELCDYQKSHKELCVSGPGEYCHGHPEIKFCKLFLVKNGPGYSPIWASDMKNAKNVVDVGVNRRTVAGSIEGVIDISGIVNNKDIARLIAIRNGLNIVN